MFQMERIGTVEIPLPKIQKTCIKYVTDIIRLLIISYTFLLVYYLDAAYQIHIKLATKVTQRARFRASIPRNLDIDSITFSQCCFKKAWATNQTKSR